MKSVFEQCKRFVCPHKHSDSERITMTIENINSHYTEKSFSDEELYLRLSVLHRKDSTFSIILIPIIILVYSEVVIPATIWLFNTFRSSISYNIEVTKLSGCIALCVIVGCVSCLPYLACVVSSTNKVIRQHEIEVINSILSKRHKKL